MRWFEVFITGPYHKKMRYVTFITWCTLDISYLLLVGMYQTKLMQLVDLEVCVELSKQNNTQWGTKG